MRSPIKPNLPITLSVALLAIGEGHAVDVYPPDWKGEMLYPLIFATEDLAPDERAARFVEWMENNDWRSIRLGIHDAYNLFDKIKIDSLDHASFSARWTGAIVAPKSGEYSFRQVRDFSGRDGRLKVTIGGKVVLDSGDPDAGEERFGSSPMLLSKGKRTPIVVELVHVVEPPIGLFSSGAPMAFLAWSREGGPESIIPTTAFVPPEDYGPDGASGLKGEYFRATDFTGLVQTRLDASLDLVWTMPPVACVHHQLAKECVDRCVAFALDGDFLAGVDASAKENALGYSLHRVAHCMTASERQQLVGLLLSRPEVVRAMSTEAMARLWQSIYMLPSGDQVTLLGEWTLAHPQPRVSAGLYPGWSDGSYQQLNTDYYWLMGLFLQGPYWEHAERLWDEYLVRPNGECNLCVAYLTAFSTRLESLRRDGRHRERFDEQLRRRLDDATVRGDVRVTWLLARAFADEVINSDHPLVRPNSEHLTEARLVAESRDYRFWALREVAARHASLGKKDDLERLLEGKSAETEPQREQFGQWRAVANDQLVAMDERRSEAAAQSALAVVADLERRREKAAAKNNQASAERYERLINSTRASLPE